MKYQVPMSLRQVIENEGGKDLRFRISKKEIILLSVALLGIVSVIVGDNYYHFGKLIADALNMLPTQIH